MIGLRCMLLLGILLLMTPPSHAQAVKSPTTGLDAVTRKKCLQILRAALRGDEFWPAMHAAEALSQAGYGAEVREVLAPKLVTETDLRRRCGLARELVRGGDPTQVAVLLDVLANTDAYGHVHACESLYKVKATGDGTLLRSAMADTASPTKALMAAAALARQGDATAMAFIREQLSTEESPSRWVAAWILGVIGSEQDLPALRNGLAKAETPRDRAYFEHALALRGDAAGQQAMLKNLKNDDLVVRADAAYMSGDAGLVAASEPLIEMLDDGNLDVTIRAAEGLLTLANGATAQGESTLVVVANKEATSASIPPEVVLDLPPGPNNSRNSEGDFVQTKDGKIIFIYSHFGKGTGDDYDTAELRERVSLDGGKTWSTEERTVVKPEAGLNVMSVSLLRLQSGEIALFYCAKVSHSDCRPQMRVSTDEGQTWSPAKDCITDLVDYYVLNNNRVIQLKSGRLVMPVCLHRTLAPKKNDWQGELMCYLSDDNGRSWKRSESMLTGKDAAGKRLTVQEPGVVELKDGSVLMIIRSSAGCQMLSKSTDGGNTWTEPVISNIISPLAPASIERIPQTGDLLLVWNDHAKISPELKGKRTPFTVAISRDEGKTWEHTKNIYAEPHGWYCYTAIDFVGNTVLLGHCAGDRRKNGLAETKVTRFDLDWLYSDAP